MGMFAPLLEAPRPFLSGTERASSSSAAGADIGPLRLARVQVGHREKPRWRGMTRALLKDTFQGVNRALRIALGFRGM